MPRHLLDLRTPRRIKSLDSPDDLLMPDFIQGFAKLIHTHSIQNRTVKAMDTHLAQLGEDVAIYGWLPICEWSNAILYNIAAQRYTRGLTGTITRKVSTYKNNVFHPPSFLLPQIEIRNSAETARSSGSILLLSILFIQSLLTQLCGSFCDQISNHLTMPLPPPPPTPYPNPTLDLR